MLPPQLLKDAEVFVKILKENPELLHTPELKFLKDYLESLDAKIPPKKHGSSCGHKDVPATEESPEEEQEELEVEEPESEESEMEFDTSNVIAEETDDCQPMGDDSTEVTEEMSDKADEKRCEAQAKFADGDYEGAVALFTESIEANPTRAVCFAKRAACYFKLRKPASAIRDCDKAIQLNPDSAAAYRWRGLSNKLLGRWEAAYLDLQTSLKLDFDENVQETVKELEPIHKRIHEHNLKWDRKREDRNYNKIIKERARRQKAYEKAKKEESEARSSYGMPSGGMPGGVPFGMGEGMPGGMSDVLKDLLSDPEMVSAMQDPELQKMFTGNPSPAAFEASMKNPKLAKLFEKMGHMRGAPNPQNPPASSPGGDDLD